ncbi:hypothetical protein HQ587_11635, partial [bacterium]|nr:hypothetical protein [bacterium]
MKRFIISFIIATFILITLQPATAEEPDVNYILWKTLEGHSEDVKSVSFSPDGSILTSVSADNTIKLWSITDGRCLKTLKGHEDWVRSVSFSPDGSLLASGSN